MLHRNIYYALKPFLPWSLRIALRRLHARRVSKLCSHRWPIRPSAAVPPVNWAGWPDGKQFALVLTHDVEGQIGLDRCENLIELEVQQGVRSSFNFVPRGNYKLPEQLRKNLTSAGFEVGVHDFRHDGKLFFSRSAFKAQAEEIRKYLTDWNAVGFRSGFMHHDLEWLQDLGVLYDASTFDTDPFEFQPEGVNTIFPFWVPSRPQGRFTGRDRSGYVELPYTLPQDSTLFILFREPSPGIWERKLDWIAAHGGMALVIVHPDYMNFQSRPCTSREYPAAFYARFLDYVQRKYADQYWMALPKQVAEFARSCFLGEPLSAISQQSPARAAI